LGDVILKDKERIQSGAGRLDLIGTIPLMAIQMSAVQIIKLIIRANNLSDKEQALEELRVAGQTLP